LGAGESGKSTIFKQMKILYGTNHGFGDDERKRWTTTVYGNILTNMKEVLNNVGDGLDEDLKGKVDGFMEVKDSKQEAHIDESTAELIKAFWADGAVQAAWERRADFQVQDALEYFVEDLDRIAASGYLPNQQDILRCRVRTSGIVEETYKIDGVDFVMYDVGGQRNERKKWIHCFDKVTAVIFVAAINEYNQVLYEDGNMNRIDEALILFEEISNSEYFTKTSMILFLNKEDLFKEKLATVPFRVDSGPDARFTDFQGPFVDIGTDTVGDPAFELACKAANTYLVQMFLNRAKKSNPNKTVYFHTTTATDTRNVQVVFDACKTIILQKNLTNSGFVSD